MHRSSGYSEGKVVAIVALCVWALLQFDATASAQNYDAMMQQNMERMRALDAQLNDQLRETQARQQAEEAKYLAQNRPALEQEHLQYMQATGMRMSLEEYVHSKIMNEDNENEDNGNEDNDNEDNDNEDNT